MCVPGLSRFHHRIELNEEFAHASDKGDLCWFTCLPQVLIEAADRRIETKACDNRHIQESA